MANTDYKSPDALMRHLRDKDTVFLYLPLTDFHSLHIMRLTQPYNMIQN